MQIAADVDAIIRAVEKLKFRRDMTAEELNQIELFVLSLDTSWQGDSERMYASKIVYIKREYEKLMEFYDSLISLLENISKRHEELERNIVKRISSI